MLMDATTYLVVFVVCDDTLGSEKGLILTLGIGFPLRLSLYLFIVLMGFFFFMEKISICLHLAKP